MVCLVGIPFFLIRDVNDKAMFEFILLYTYEVNLRCRNILFQREVVISSFDCECIGSHMVKVRGDVINYGAVLTSLVWSQQFMFHVFCIYCMVDL